MIILNPVDPKLY